MAAQTQKRIVRPVQFKTKEIAASAATYYQGSTVCFDTSVGRIVKATASTTLLPIGFSSEDKVIANNGDLLHVTLFREVTAYWFANLGGDAVVAGDLGKLCFLDDDQTVRKTDNTNANSVAGRIWAVDSVRGVLVEPRFISDTKTTSPGLDV
jgi:hypothetical protein